MAQQIQLRRDTAANWATANPVLALGEMGVETDTRLFKFGDAVTAWNGLAYAAAGVTIEQVQDNLGGTSLLAGTSLTKVYDDVANTITLNVDSADFATAAQGAKVDFLTVTQPVNLDQLELDVAGLANGMVYRGDWDASLGAFPSGANTGDFYYVSVAGTVNAVTFDVGDNIVAIVDAASTTIYAGNWSKHDQTDAVQSVAGRVGAVTLNADDISDAATAKKFTTAADITKLAGIEALADVTDTTNVTAAGALMDSEVTNLAQVKAFNAADYATAAQGTLATNAVPKSAVPVTLTIAVGDETTAITTGTSKVSFRMPHAMTLTGVRASLVTASSSGIPTFDINEAGVSILSTKLTIDATETTSTTAATAAVISDSALADDALITIDIDVAGTAAAGPKITLIGTRAV